MTKDEQIAMHRKLPVRTRDLKAFKWGLDMSRGPGNWEAAEEGQGA